MILVANFYHSNWVMGLKEEQRLEPMQLEDILLIAMKILKYFSNWTSRMRST